MDEGLLNDLLECSVCLERLDTSSRVLPCQHTFCLKCLKVIVESHKELRCPECRVLVEAKVEELPPNVLLMRILEGMRNSAPRKLVGQRPQRSGHSQVQQHGVQPSTREGKQLPPHGRAMYDYISKDPTDLSFKKGETILFHKKLDPFWYQGECSGRTGMFPITYVQVIVPLPVPNALCKALYDFRMSAPDEEGCLAFDKGAIITVHRRVDENWAEGRLDQRVGIFPIAFVELNQPARQLMNSAPPGRSAPPPPGCERHHAQHSQRYQQMSMSTPTQPANYQNVATMSQSHPNFHANHQPTPAPTSQMLAQTLAQTANVSHGGVITATAIPRNIVEPTQTKHALDLIHFNNKQINTFRQKYESYNSTPVHKVESTYQNVRSHDFPVTIANFNANASSDSSSSMNTPAGVSSTTTPNTSDTSSEAEPSIPSSPDNNTERNTTVIAGNTNQNPEEENNDADTSINASMGVLSLNESSTATNTSLNVSLPPAESPKLNASGASSTSQNQSEAVENASNIEPSRLDVPSSSKVRSGPDSLLNFGLGLQAALSPSHGKDGGYVSRHRDHHHKEKRHSLTPSTHLQGNQSTPNRHSAEILATSLLDHSADRADRERDKRRRRSRSSERPLPAAYVALYTYKPQKPDELELHKGAMYTVTERCRDGWYKGCGARGAGVFPGNYVLPAAHIRPAVDKQTCVMATVKPTQAPSRSAPDAPPRADSPLHAQPMSYPWVSSTQQQSTPRSEKSKEKSKLEKTSISSGVSLMKRLAAMKKCKSPPPGSPGYSMDNPVFEDGPGAPGTPAGQAKPGTSLMMLAGQHHPVHVRSGSCPAQLLRALPASGGSERLRRRERPAVLPREHRTNADTSNPWQSQHRKSQSLDVTANRKERHHSQPVKERFRCIVPYPPNSEYELELKVDDIVIVSKKRGDGWYKGTLQRTGRTGLFPASFVQSYPE